MVSTAQHLTDLAAELSSRGHRVTVLTSNRGYDDPSLRFSPREQWNGIDIIRIGSLSLGKNSRWRRVLTFASYLVVCALRLAVLRRFDAVVALTSPPLISFIGALFVRIRGGRFHFWVMDLNPDEAIAAGWLSGESLVARMLKRPLVYSLKHASQIIALDRFMEKRIKEKGIKPERITVLPPWAHDDAVNYEDSGRTAFRKQHGLSDKFVVMYSGNHSPCHSLDTLLNAALELQNDDSYKFCFIGGGSEQEKVREFSLRHAPTNILCLPYQPLSGLSASLSAADLHVVVMGDRFVGIIHPCKIYNILRIGSPVLYIGPDESHVTDLAARDGEQFFLCRHGDVDGVVKSIQEAMQVCRKQASQVAAASSKQELLPRLVELIETNGRSFAVFTEVAASEL